MNRRLLFLLPLALAACGTQPTAQPMTVASVAAGLATAIDIASQTIAAQPGQGTNQTAILAKARVTSDALKIIAAGGSTMNVKTISADVTALAPLLIGLLPPGSPYVVGLQIAVSLVPTLLSMAGVAPAPAAPAAAPMSVEARLAKIRDIAAMRR